MRHITLPWKRTFGALVFVAGCNGLSSLPPAPSAPSAAPARPSDSSVPTAANPSSASVVVEDPFAIVRRDGSGFGYAVRFLLREATGVSGATVGRIVVYGPNGSNEAGPGCWRDQLQLPAGGALDTFYTNARASWLGYCAPGSSGATASPMLYVLVEFSDDHGVGGSVGFPVSTVR